MATQNSYREPLSTGPLVEGAQVRLPGAATSGAATRLVGVDWAKGALVLIMVFYHWMNYFIGLDSDVYRYIRFLTPSFIFVAGFLVSHIYLRKYHAGDGRVPGRLLRRGGKLLLLVLGLNILAVIAGTGIAARRVSGLPPWDLVRASILGLVPVAFSVLVPIGYLLILSAGLVIMARRSVSLLHLVSSVLLFTAWLMDRQGLQNGYLEMLSLGMLGVSVGCLSTEAIHSVTRYPLTLLATYAVYLVALTMWNATYAVQVLGVCVNLAVLYWLGAVVLRQRAWPGTMIRLGEYSLFAYIAQIVIIQVLWKGFRTVQFGPGGPELALLAAFACTILSVEAAHRARLQAPVLDRIYRTVFS